MVQTRSQNLKQEALLKEEVNNTPVMYTKQDEIKLCEEIKSKYPIPEIYLRKDMNLI